MNENSSFQKIMGKWGGVEQCPACLGSVYPNNRVSVVIMELTVLMMMTTTTLEMILNSAIKSVLCAKRGKERERIEWGKRRGRRRKGRKREIVGLKFLKCFRFTKMFQVYAADRKAFCKQCIKCQVFVKSSYHHYVMILRILDA